VTCTQWLNPKEGPEVPKFKTSLGQQHLKVGKNGGIDLKICKDLGVTSI
jgi:hypothetical protein